MTPNGYIVHDTFPDPVDSFRIKQDEAFAVDVT